MVALLEQMLRDVRREIAAIEMRSAARTAGLLALNRDGADTAEQDRLMSEDMRTLDGLRQEQRVLKEALERPDLPASAQDLLDLADAKLRLVLEARLQDLRGQG